MANQSDVLGYSYEVFRILVLLAVYVVLLSVKTLAAVVGHRLQRIQVAGRRLVGRSRSQPHTSSRP